MSEMKYRRLLPFDRVPCGTSSQLRCLLARIEVIEQQTQWRFRQSHVAALRRVVQFLHDNPHVEGIRQFEPRSTPDGTSLVAESAIDPVDRARIDRSTRDAVSAVMGCLSCDGGQYSQFPDRRIPEGLRDADRVIDRGLFA